MANSSQISAYNPYLFSQPCARLNNYFYRSKYNPKPATLSAKIAQTLLGYPFRRLGQSILSRITGVAFAVFLALDCSRNIAKALHSRLTLLFTKNPNQRTLQYEMAYKCERAAKLLLLSIPTTLCFSLYSPDIVSRHYVPNQPRAGVLEAGGKFHYAMGTSLYPKNLEEVIQIVELAIRDGKKISIVGAGFSQSGDSLPALPHSVSINMSKVNHMQLNEEEQTVTVGAGATWIELMLFLNEKGYANRVSQASGVFSVGGSLGVNCHGWSPESPLVNVVTSITLVNAKAEVVFLKPQDELFQLVVGGHGNFGIIVEATLKVIPNVELTPNVKEIPLKDYAKTCLEEIKGMKETVMFLGRLDLDPNYLLRGKQGKVMHVTYKEHSLEGVKNAPLIPEPPSGYVLMRVLLHVARSFKIARNVLWFFQKRGMYQEKIAPRNIIMNPDVLCAFDGVGDAILQEGDASWLQEYFVKPENLEDFVLFLGKKLQDNNVRLFNASIRYVRADHTTKLPYAPYEDHFAIVLFFHQSLAKKDIENTQEWVRDVIEKLHEVGGTFYLPYARLASPQQFEKIYNRHGHLDFVRQKKKEYDPTDLFYNQFYAQYLATDPLQELKQKRLEQLRTLANDKKIQNDFKNFLTEVLFQLDPDRFYQLLEEVFQKEVTYEEAYKKLCLNIHKAKNGLIGNTRDLFKSIAQIKKIFGSNLAKLMGKGGVVDGVLDIGTPARNIQAGQKEAGITFIGKKYSANDQERLTDYAQTGIGKRPYDEFIELGDYNPLTDRIKPASLDMVICTIGLHHIVKEKLQPFIESILNILRPGGSLILRDHDVRKMDPHSELMAELAHSVFNIANQVPFEGKEGEFEEIRDFQSIEEWTNLLEAHGFVRVGNQYIDDASNNALIRLVKKPQTEEEYLPALERQARTEGRTRPLEQTYLTTLEWLLVDVARDYAEFLENHPVKDFPFLKHVSILVKAFIKSISKGREANPSVKGLFSEYMMMNYFMLFCTTPELLLKALAYAPLKIWPGSSDSHKLASQKLLLDMSEKYAKFIETTPSYQFPQKNWMLAALKNIFRLEFKKFSFLNTYINATIIGEACGKIIALTPINMLYSDRQIELDRISLILKIEEKKFNEFYQDFSDRSKHELDAKVIAAYGEYTLIQTTRYYPLRDFLIECALYSIPVSSIAGQKKIQIKIKDDKTSDLYQSLPATSLIQQIEIPTDSERDYFCLDVEIEHLHEILSLLKNENVEITYIHDF